MQSLKILTFNWHDPYIYLFGQTGQDIHVCDWMRRADGTQGWDYQKRPLRDNLHQIKDQAEAVAGLDAGEYDLAVAHTLQDIKFLNSYDIPAIFLTHNALHNDGMGNQVAMNQIRGMVAEFVDRPNRLFAAISHMKLNSWGLDGAIIPPGIDTADYGGYTGEVASALAVGNLFVERDYMLGYSALSEALENLPHQYVGENPSMTDAKKADNWDDLKSFYRSHRVYANATVEAFEDGYNLGMLEAMATGMPVVTMANATTPIVDGTSGFVCETPQQMTERVQALLDDVALATRMGSEARKTVEEDFSVAAFVDVWTRAFEHVVSGGTATASQTAFKLDVEPGQMYAYDAADVNSFLSTPDQVSFAKAKIDRYGGALMIDFVLVNSATGKQAVWAGFMAQVNGDKLNAEFPPYLSHLTPELKKQVEQVLVAVVGEALKPEHAQTHQIHINLEESDTLVSRVGNDRITPGDVRADVYLHHAKRYGFASQFCADKDVVDVASGTGYGSKILSRYANRVVAMDLEADPLRYGRLTFDADHIRRSNADMRALPLADDCADTVICFEAIEHITEHADFVNEVHRVLRSDGTFVVSTPNLDVYGRPENDNPYHVGMLSEKDFTDLLESFFEDVAVVNQERASGNRNFYDYFNFTDDPGADKEIHIAVCTKPLELSRGAGEQRSGGENLSEKVAETVATPVVEVRENEKEAVVPAGGERLKILFAQVSNPISAGRSYVDTLRTAHDVITCGPSLDLSDMDAWREAEKQHALKRDNAGEKEKLDLMMRLVEPCDIPLEAGQIDMQQILAQLPDGWTPDLFVWADNAAGFLPLGMNQLNCPSVALVGDTHTGQMQWRMDYAKMFTNAYLMFTRHHIPEFQAAGIENIGWLPAACDPRYHGKFDVAKSYEIGFVGQTHRQWHPHRVALLEQLKDAGFDLHAESKILEEMSLFHSRSKIVFNRSLNEDLNRRVFEVLCSGSMLLTDRLPEASGLEQLFTDREHCVLYDDNNLIDLAKYYLEHKDEREAIAARGRQVALSEHTYASRANQMLGEVMGDGVARCVDPGQTPQATAVPEPTPVKSLTATLKRNDEVAPAIQELSAYTGESPEAIQAQMTSSGADLADEWRSGSRDTAERVDDFYKQTDRYLYNLTRFNDGEMYRGWRGAIRNVCQLVSEAVGNRGFDVLDYGAGIGTNLIDVADLQGIRLHYADLPGKTYDYANWRFQQRGLNVEMLSAEGEDPLAGRMFDVIVCLDVIEHLVDPEAAVRRLINHLNPGGLLVLTVTFYQNEHGPYHLNCDKFTNESFYKLVEQIGMKELSSFSPHVFQKTGVEEVSATESTDGPVFNTQEEIDRFLHAWDGPVRMNLGCGPDNRAGYINVDAYVDNADLKMDIFNLPLEADSVDEVFSSHMLEHLGKFEVPEALKEWYRILKPTGKLQLNLPDLEWSARQWLDLPEDSRWGWPLDTLFGLQTHPGEYHKTGFTADRIEKLLRHVGFKDVQTSWSWSHGLRCIWVEAGKSEKPRGLDAELDRFQSQFITDLSDIVPYAKADCEAFFANEDWRVGFVSFERLPMDSNIYTINVALKQGDRQMILQCLRLFGVDQNPVLWFPSYLQETSQAVQSKIGEKVSAAFKAMVDDPSFREGQFVFARFGDDGDVGLEADGERVIPGLTDMSLYIPHIKRYLLARSYCEGKQVLDAGCGTGYGSKLLSHVAASVHAVDVAEDALAFCQKTYASPNLSWNRADVRELNVEKGAYDVVTSFEVIEHLERADIPAYLEGLQSALRPDGVALISTPNRLVAQQWDNPHHHTEMTREEFERTLSEYFTVETMLGQVTWTQDREVPGQSYVSRRVTDDDDMFIAVCRPLATGSPIQPTRKTDQAAAKPSARPNATGSAKTQSDSAVDVVIPLYNKVEFTRACLESLERTKNETPYRLILVDNGSTDATAELLEEWADRAIVVRPGENLGFSGGNNLGATHGDSPYVLFLNNDTVAEDGWLDRLFDEFEAHPEVGIAGPKLLYPNRTIQHAGIEIINGTPDHVHRNEPEDRPAANVKRDLDMVTGACLMIRRDLFAALGGFDEQYVNGVEDVDLCLRARDRGFVVRYVPEAVLEHHEGMSDGRYDHVQPNLQKFANRFQSRFDREGRFIPVVRGEMSKSTDRTLRGVWEGTQFVRSSLSIVNMAMTGNLLKDDRVELSLVPFEPPTFGPQEDPARYGHVAEALSRPLSGLPDFHVRHKWPPDLSSPASGHWIMFQPWEFGRIPKAWVEPIQNRVDEVWVYSFYVKQCYIDSGIDPDRVQVVPLGVDCSRFNPEAKPLKLATDKTFKFLFVGGTIYRKGIDVLLNAYRQAYTADDDVCLVLKGVGEDSFYKGQTAGDLIREIQHDPKAPEILYLTEELSDTDIAGLYTACDCLVHPYRGEGFGLPVAEAMACDLPVIVTRGGSTDDFCVDETVFFVEAERRDIAFNEETAGQTWLFEPQTESLIEQMNLVLNDPDAAAEKGKLGGAHIRENLTWEQASDRAVERLEVVCAQPIRREIVLAGEAESSPESSDANLTQDTIDCLLVADENEGHELAGHAHERFTNVSLRSHVVAADATQFGLGAQLNAKLPEIESDLVLLMREGTIVTEGWFDSLKSAFEVEDVGIAVPSMPDGRGEQSVAPRYSSKKKELQKFARKLRNRNGGQVVDIASAGASCVLIRKIVLEELGGFEATFQSGAYIDDLIRRAHQRGYKAVCVKEAYVHSETVEPSIDDARERKAVAHLAEGDRHRLAEAHDDALASYRVALDLKEDYVEAALVCSATLLEMDLPEEAAEPFLPLVEKYPDSARIQNYLGRCLFRAGKPEEAKARFEHALTLMPGFAEAMGNLAVLLWEQGRLDEAVEYMSAAAELAPNDPDTLFNIGMIYAQLGQGAEAIDALSSYLTVSPEDNDTRVHLAALLIDNGKESEGLAQLEHVLSEVPDHEDATRVLRQLEVLVAANEGPQGA